MDEHIKKVMFLDKSNIFAGAEYCLLSLCNNLDLLKFKVSLVFDYPKKHHKKYRENNTPVSYRNSKLKFWMGTDYSLKNIRGADLFKRIIFSFQLAYIIYKNKIDIFHINLLRSTDYLDVKIAKFMGCKVIGHVRSLESQAHIKTSSLNACDYVLATSEYVLNEINRPNIAIPLKRIYDPIDINDYNTSLIDKDEIRNKYGIEKYNFVISSIAILDKRKGHETAIKAFSEVLKVKPNCKLLVAGGRLNENNNEKIRLQKIADGLNLGDKIIFTGHVDKVVDIFAITDLVLALSSDGEAFGRIPLEAASSKKVVIATNLGATPEIVVDKITGFLVKPNDPMEVFKLVYSLMNSKDEMKRISENAYSHVFKNFSANIHSKLVQEVYASLN